MFAILLIALCVVTAHAQYNSGYYSCPPDTLAAAQFRMLTADLGPQEVPTVEQAQRDLWRASSEIRNLAQGTVSKALSYQKQFDLLIYPFVSRCCEQPNYNCSHVDIPLLFIWYRYSYYSPTFCFVIYPAGEETINYTKCTCMTCVRDSYCPVIGRCVETNYTYHYIIVYCPKQYYGYRYKILLVAVPKDCECMTYCPNNYYRSSYGYSRRSLGSSFRSASPLLSVATARSATAPRSAVPAEAADGQESPPEGPSETPKEGGSPSESSDGEI